MTVVLCLQLFWISFHRINITNITEIAYKYLKWLETKTILKPALANKYANLKVICTLDINCS